MDLRIASLKAIKYENKNPFSSYNNFLMFFHRAPPQVTMESNGPSIRTLNHVAHHPVAQNGVVQIKTTETTTVNGNGTSNEGSSSPNTETAAAGKLFVGGLSWQTSSEKLRQYFGMFGNITDVLIMKDPVTQVFYF